MNEKYLYTNKFRTLCSEYKTNVTNDLCHDVIFETRIFVLTIDLLNLKRLKTKFYEIQISKY